MYKPKSMTSVSAYDWMSASVDTVIVDVVSPSLLIIRIDMLILILSILFREDSSTPIFTIIGAGSSIPAKVQNDGRGEL